MYVCFCSFSSSLTSFVGCVRRPVVRECGREAWQLIFRVLKDTTQTLMPGCVFPSYSSFPSPDDAYRAPPLLATLPSPKKERRVYSFSNSQPVGAQQRQHASASHTVDAPARVRQDAAAAAESGSSFQAHQPVALPLLLLPVTLVLARNLIL